MGVIHNKPVYMIFATAIFSCAIFFMEVCSKKKESYEAVSPPMAKKMRKELSRHGHARFDDYYWLRDRDNPEVIAYLKAENDYAKKAMAHTERLQEKLIGEFQNLEEHPNQPVTYRKGDYLYYERFDKGMQYPIYCRKKVPMEADEEVLLDANHLAEGHDVFALAGR